MNQSTKELNNSIESLYVVFKDYKLRSDIDACDHCYSEKDKELLLSKPIKELTTDDLISFAYDAITLFGDVHDFKCLLPRLCEQVAKDPNWVTDVEITFSKFQHGEWNKWSEDEQLAVRNYFHTLWSFILDNYPAPASMAIDEIICGISQAEDNISHYLNSWINCASSEGYKHLTDFLEDEVRNNSRLVEQVLDNPFWETRPEQMKQLVAWLIDPQTLLDLEKIKMDKNLDCQLEAESAYDLILEVHKII